MALLAAFLIGIVAGLRTFTAPAAISWAAYWGHLQLEGTPLAFLAYWLTPWIFTILALIEFVGDQLPSTPSRKTPIQFGARIVSGGFCGAAIGFAIASWPIGLLVGALGAIVGTLGGYEARKRLAEALGKDLPAAVFEDAVAVIAALFIAVWLL